MFSQILFVNLEYWGNNSMKHSVIQHSMNKFHFPSKSTANYGVIWGSICTNTMYVTIYSLHSITNTRINENQNNIIKIIPRNDGEWGLTYTWDGKANNRALIFRRTIFASWTSSSILEIAFWTARSCSIVFIGGGDTTLTSDIGFPWLVNLVRNINTAENNSTMTIK